MKLSKTVVFRFREASALTCAPPLCKNKPFTLQMSVWYPPNPGVRSCDVVTEQANFMSKVERGFLKICIIVKHDTQKRGSARVKC